MSVAIYKILNAKREVIGYERAVSKSTAISNAKFFGLDAVYAEFVKMANDDIDSSDFNYFE